MKNLNQLDLVSFLRMGFLNSPPLSVSQREYSSEYLLGFYDEELLGKSSDLLYESLSHSFRWKL